ncbi:serine/threonine-protein kinase KIN2 [Rhizopus stolonifer]|uniref:non-specific serine/threonine protein kinase n=1 Tax=Rhizopus stolonifer TaxID=4846 RepID=A0A367KQH2_RHIST|nr:serine/threonine-protein kinase KIN2 [Rhizopus stolonifer]
MTSSNYLGESSRSILDYLSDTGTIVVGPDGGHILCDSPLPSELPPYTGPDETHEKKHTVNKKAPVERTTKPRRVIGNYTLINTLGSGSMGKVRLAVHNITGDKLAVKIVPRKPSKDHKKKEKDENREIRTIREASIMLLLHHPFIVSLKEMVVLDPYYYLFMEYVNGGQLLDYIIAHGKLKEKQARRFGRQILSALDYCHRNSIVHRDLKIENILISQSGNIKIIDFGLSNLFSPRSSLSTFCGSLYFAAPELLNAKNYTGPEVDIWSFGVVLYVLVCGKVPFDDQNMAALHEKIKRGVVEYPSHLSTDCKSVLSRMLVINPTHRATVSEVMIHPWMNKGYDGPVDNYLPERVPLSLPIDIEVVRGMTGFEFGTEAEIKQKLEKIITSDEYQKAAKMLVERTAEIQRHHRHQHARFSPHAIANKKAFVLSNDDPQSIPAAYHPLVSIYYLVKERMEREKRLEAAKQQQHKPCIPDISLPEHVHPASSTGFEQSLFGDPDMFTNHVSMGVAYGRKGKKQLLVEDEGPLDSPEKLHAIENGLNRLFSKNSHHHIRSFSGEEEGLTGINRTASRESTSDSPNVLRRLSLALTRPSSEKRTRKPSMTMEPVVSPVSSSTSTPLQIPSSRSPSPQPRKEGPSDIEVAKAAAAAAVAANHNNSNTFGNKFSKMIPRRMTLGQNSMNIENHANFLNMVHGHHHHHQHHQPEEARLASSKGPVTSLPSPLDQNFSPPSLPPKQGTADENIKPVFLKGLFSVTTTTTKHPSVIRADLILVLERIGVKWRESKGRFECVHIPSIDLNRVVDQHEVEEALSSSSEDTPATVPVPDLVVRFEIYIVKVPWLLGMHGLQFRRVSGDPWQYKNMCSKILAELKL